MKQEQVTDFRLRCAEESNRQHTHTQRHTQEWVIQKASDVPFHLPTLASGAQCSVLVWWASAWEGGSQASVALLDLQPHGSSCRARPHQRSDPQTKSYTWDWRSYACPMALPNRILQSHISSFKSARLPASLNQLPVVFHSALGMNQK